MNVLSPARVLPTLALSRFDGDAAVRRAFLADLRRAAREVGFFYVTDHGVPSDLNRAVLDQATKLFPLPEDTKPAIAMVNSPHFRGYNRAGLELTRGKPDWREQLDVGAERAPIPQSSGTPPY